MISGSAARPSEGSCGAAVPQAGTISNEGRVGRLDLQEVARRSGLLSAKLTPATMSQTVSLEGKLYKVRRYVNEPIAERQAQLIRTVPWLFPNFAGRVGPCLVFEYLKGVQPEGSPDFYTRAGLLLAELAVVKGDKLLDEQFDYWCDELVALGVFLPQTAGLIHRHYVEYRPLSVRGGLAYLDAKPGNMVLADDGQLLPVDEKHLCFGPLHLSLYKAMTQFTAEEFALLRESYCRRLADGGFDDPAYREYVYLYLLIRQLFLAATTKPTQILLRPLTHQRRLRVLELIGAPRITRLREEMHFGVRYRLRRCVDDSIYYAARAKGVLLGLTRMMPSIRRER